MEWSFHGLFIANFIDYKYRWGGNDIRATIADTAIRATAQGYNGTMDLPAVLPNGSVSWGAGHEFGHIMGLRDRYDVLGTGLTDPGWENTLMGQYGASLSQKEFNALNKALKKCGL